MKKQLFTFAAGMLTAALLGSLGVGALAASGAVSFNTVGLMVKGVPVSAPGEDYVLASGQRVPGTIVYTDEAGGGTTYLPARRVAELLGEEVGYDVVTGSVTVGQTVSAVTAAPEESAAPEASSEPETVQNYNFDYSYEEFLGLWDIEPMNFGSGLFFVAKDKKAGVWWQAASPEILDTYLIRSAGEKLEEYGLAPNLMTLFRDADKANWASVFGGEVINKH